MLSSILTSVALMLIPLAALAVGAVVLVVGLSRGKERGRVWQSFADRHGLRLKKGFDGIRVQGTIDGFQVSAWAYALGSAATMRTFHVIELTGLPPGSVASEGDTQVLEDGRVRTEFRSANPECLDCILADTLSVARRRRADVDAQ